MEDWKEIYQTLGFYLFPIIKNIKVPPDGFKWRERSSKDPKDWEMWATQYKGCNWALDCGKSGFIVVDIDKNDGKPGMASWKALLEELGRYPETQLVARSARGGEHRFYRGICGSLNNWRPGIDIKSDGGYVLVEPSTFESKPYQFVCDGEPHFIDSAFFALLPKKEDDVFSKLRPRPNLAPGQRVAEGSRDEDLFTECCWAYLKDKLSVDDLVRHAIAFDAEHYGLGERTARRKAKSVTDRFEQTGEEKVNPYFLPLNDDGNSQRLFTWFSDEFIYTNLGWHEWTGTIWKGKAEGRILMRSAQKFQELKNESKKKEKAAENEESKEAAKIATKFFNTSCNLARLKNMITIAQERFRKEDTIFDANPWLFNTLLGAYDLRSGEVKAPNRTDYITKNCGWKPEPDKDCPTFRKLIIDAMDGDEEKAAFLTSILASSLSGCVRDQKIVLNHGDGNNGKTTLFEKVMLSLMGEYGADINVNSFLDNKNSGGDKARPDLVRLIGIRFGTMAEPKKGKVLDDSLIKRITGGGPMTERNLREGYVTWISQLHLFMSFNDEPSLSDFSFGMRRRLAFVEWRRIFKRDDAFEMKVIGEIPAIIPYLVKQCLAWYEQGLTVPLSVDQATQEYMDGENREAQWLSDCATRLDPEWRLSASLKNLYESYFLWCKENNEKYVLSKTKFSKALQKLGFRKNPHRGSETTFLDIELKKCPQTKSPQDESGQDDGDKYWTKK